MMKRFKRSIVAVFLSALLLGSGYAEEQRAEPAQARLGINLAGPADWNTELPFVDVFRLSRPWISQKQGQPWGSGPELELDEHGWVTQLEPNCWAETLMCTIDGDHYPSGTYTVLYEGEGKLEFWGAASLVDSSEGRMNIEVDAAKGAFFLKLIETDPNNPVRNIRVIMPGFENIYKDEPFHPAFLQRWQGMACVRFMDWMKTNGSPISHWSDRPKPDDATFSVKGVALEWMIDLCNRLEADAWFCMPHQADDEYVRNFAAMVKDGLAPNLGVYVEYSNEVWNSRFAQTQYSWDRGTELNLGPEERPWEGGGRYYARRSVDIFRIWKEVFGDRGGLVHVLAWQSGNTWWMENIVLTHEDAYKEADALAIAPYLGMGVPLEGEGLTADQVAGWTIEQVFDHLETVVLPSSVRDIEASKQVADQFGLKLIAYEGGQHLVGINGAQEHEALTSLFHAVNAHERMEELYQTYFDAWTQAGGDVFCYFSSVSRWSKWGSWGAMQFYDDDILASPKMKAILQWAQSRGQDVTLPDAETHP